MELDRRWGENTQRRSAVNGAPIPFVRAWNLGRAMLTIVSIAALLVSLVAITRPVSAAPGNNGTLKIHEQGTPSGTESNDPKVCIFNFEGFGFDASQAGYIMIDGQGQTSGSFGPYPFGPTNVGGYADTQYFNDSDGPTIPDGHYKATLYGKDLPSGGINLQDEKAKSKVFKLICGGDNPEPTPTPTDKPEPTPTPTDNPEQTPTPTPTDKPEPTPTDAPQGDTASLNIKKIDADTGRTLNGAVFKITGIDGTFESGSGTWDVNGNHVPDGTDQAVTRKGFVCIIGLPADSFWTVTEINPPVGYEGANPDSQLVEVDDDGDCASPDVVFENAMESAAPTPTGTPEGSVQPGTGTPSATGTPEGGVKAGQGTPGASQPDTAIGSIAGSNPAPTMLFVIILLLSLGGLAYANVDTTRRRR